MANRRIFFVLTKSWYNHFGKSKGGAKPPHGFYFKIVASTSSFLQKMRLLEYNYTIQKKISKC